MNVKRSYDIFFRRSGNCCTGKMASLLWNDPLFVAFLHSQAQTCARHLLAIDPDHWFAIRKTLHPRICQSMNNGPHTGLWRGRMLHNWSGVWELQDTVGIQSSTAPLSHHKCCYWQLMMCNYQILALYLCGGHIFPLWKRIRFHWKLTTIYQFWYREG